MWISSTLIGQNTKLVVKYFSNSKQIMEEYHVLNNDENIKQGEYIRYYRISDKDFTRNKEKYIFKRGFYYNNQLDSTWIYYHYNASYYWIDREENYNKGRKVGIWKTYLEYGSVIKRLDYNLNKEIEPEFRIYTHYPAIASEMQIQGVVKVRVVYNNDCTIGGISVVQSSAPNLDSDAINCVSNFEKLRLKYSLIKDCSTKRDSTYTINYKLNE